MFVHRVTAEATAAAWAGRAPVRLTRPKGGVKGGQRTETECERVRTRRTGLQNESGRLGTIIRVEGKPRDSDFEKARENQSSRKMNQNSMDKCVRALPMKMGLAAIAERGRERGGGGGR